MTRPRAPLARLRAWLVPRVDGPIRPTLRLRLAAVYSGLFLVMGALLLTISYELVRSQLSVSPDEIREVVAQLETRELPQSWPPGPNFELRVERIPQLSPFQQVQQELADAALRRLTAQYLIALAVMTVLSALLGWFVAGRALRPLHDITDTAKRVSQGTLHERIGLVGPDDELKELADTFDAMLGRLDAAFQRQSAFVANASHELRTPLAIIRAETDLAAGNPRVSKERLLNTIGVVQTATARSERLIDSLLKLARADHADRPRQPSDLAQLAGTIVDGARERAAAAGLRLDTRLDPVTVVGDRGLLEMLVSNLLDNALRYNERGGWLSVTTGRAGNCARIEVANSGARVSAEQAERLTEPFRRVGTRTADGGQGLGLSIVESVAAAHGGMVAIEPGAEGGLTVRVDLPAA